jgi:hypothetical protein
MLLIGHELIPSEPFYHVDTLEKIAQTPSNAKLYFEFDAALARYCSANGLVFALHVKNIKELVLGNALGASFFIVDKSLALQAQKIADDYLFDAKILLIASDDNDIEFAALHGIDGLIFNAGLIV